MTITNEKGLRLLSWIPAYRVEPYLDMYEQVAQGSKVNAISAARRLGRLTLATLEDWRHRKPNPKVDLDFDNEMTVDIKWVKGLANKLIYSANSQEATLALEEFFNHYHEDLEEGREKDYENTPAGRMVTRLRRLSRYQRI